MLITYDNQNQIKIINIFSPQCRKIFCYETQILFYALTIWHFETVKKCKRALTRSILTDSNCIDEEKNQCLDVPEKNSELLLQICPFYNFNFLKFATYSGFWQFLVLTSHFLKLISESVLELCKTWPDIIQKQTMLRWGTLNSSALALTLASQTPT